MLISHVNRLKLKEIGDQRYSVVVVVLVVGVDWLSEIKEASFFDPDVLAKRLLSL